MMDNITGPNPAEDDRKPYTMTFAVTIKATKKAEVSARDAEALADAYHDSLSALLESYGYRVQDVEVAIQ